MCGRYSLSTEALSILEQLFGTPVEHRIAPTYNMKPTDSAAILRLVDGQRAFDCARWGLVPPWLMTPPTGPPLINARAETVAEKPSFKHAFRTQRCLVPADGFYEWSAPQPGASRGTKKQPWHFHMKDRSPFAFAGLWEPYQTAEGTPALSYTLLTTEPNALVATVHDRMPVILPPEAYAFWLDSANQDPATLVRLLAPYPAAGMAMVPVGPGVGQVDRDDPSLIAPVPRSVMPPLF